MYYKVTKSFLEEFQGNSEGVGRLEIASRYDRQYFSEEQLDYSLVFEKFEEMMTYFGYYEPLNVNLPFNLALQALQLEFIDLKHSDYNGWKSQILQSNIKPNLEISAHLEADLDIICEVVDKNESYTANLFKNWRDSIVVSIERNSQSTLTFVGYYFNTRVELFNEYPYGKSNLEYYLPPEMVIHNRTVLTTKIEGLIRKGFVQISGDSPFLYDNELEKYGLRTLGRGDPANYHK